MIDPAYFLSPLIWYILICLHLSIHTTVFEHMSAFVQYCECVCVWAYEECALKKGAHCAYGAHGREVCGSSGRETLISRVKRQKKVLLLCFGRTEALHTQPKAAEKPIIRNWRRQRHGNWAIFFCALIFFPLLQQLCLSLFLYAVLWQNKRAL